MEATGESAAHAQFADDLQTGIVALQGVLDDGQPWTGAATAPLPAFLHPIESFGQS